MNINWKVRVKNKLFWVSMIPALLVFVKVLLELVGVTMDFTALQDKLIALVGAVFSVLSILGIVVDPTTDGVSDSTLAMTYDKPREG